MQDAAEVLPQNASSRGHITKGAALSLLGRVALYNEKWDDAIAAYKPVSYTHLDVDKRQGYNRVWVGSNGNGLDLYDRKNDRFVSVLNDYFRNGDVVFSMLEDDRCV